MTFKANVSTTDDVSPELREALRGMIGQLPIVFALRAGGELRIPVAEVDATGAHMLDIAVEGTDFVFRTRKKQ